MCGAALPTSPPAGAPQPGAPPPPTAVPTPTPTPTPAMAPSGLDSGLRPGYLPSNVGLLEDASLRPVVYAGFWRRFVAALLDGLILWVIETVVFMVIAVLASGASRSSAATIGLVAFVLDFLIGILYYALQESSAKQATLGKRALGIMVTDTHGRPISFGRALGRTLGKFISGFILLIGYLMAAFTARKQALHDLMAGTLVVVGRASDRDR